MWYYSIIYFFGLCMALLYSLDIGSSYNFQLLAPAILGTGHNGATVLGLLDYSSAIQLEDVSAIHASVLPLLPNGTPTDAKLLVYVKIKTATGEIRVLALNWIATQPTLSTVTNLTVVLSNVTVSDIPTLTSALKANGFSSFTIS